MAIVDIRDSNFIKLKSLKKEYLSDFCEHNSIGSSGNITDIISSVLSEFDKKNIIT